MALVDNTGPAGAPAAGQAAVPGSHAGPQAGWAAVLGGLAVVSLAATLPLTVLSGQLGEGIVAVVIGIPCAGVGFLVARRQPGNPLDRYPLSTISETVTTSPTHPSDR